MKRKKLDLSPEKQIITFLITSNEFAKQIMPIFSPNDMKSEYAQIVGSWIKEFYDIYKEVPGKTIQDLYREKKGSIEDEETGDLVADFLQKLSNEYDDKIPNNLEFSLAKAEKYIRIRSAEMLIDDLQDAVQKDDEVIAEQLIANYKRKERTSGEDVSVLKDDEAIIDAFGDEEEVLFRFKGVFGEVVGDLHRGDFFSYFAPMKRGKSFLLWHTAETAMKKGLKVVFFTLEMTKKQMIRRAWKSITGLPSRTREIEIPYFEDFDNGDYAIKKKVVEREGFSLEKVKETQTRIRKMFRKGDVRIIQLLGYQATVSTIESYLDNLSYYDEFVPDVIVIDYADLLVASKRAGREVRHQLDDIWKGLRRISQQRNILVVTASQTAKQTFERDVQRGDAAEDIRKIAHITSGVAINQKKSEVEQQAIRISQLVTREERAVTHQAIVLQCLDIGKACLDSRVYKNPEEGRGK